MSLVVKMDILRVILHQGQIQPSAGKVSWIAPPHKYERGAYRVSSRFICDVPEQSEGRVLSTTHVGIGWGLPLIPPERINLIDEIESPPDPSKYERMQNIMAMAVHRGRARA
jgi:hypothetical protein